MGTRKEKKRKEKESEKEKGIYIRSRKYACLK